MAFGIDRRDRRQRRAAGLATLAGAAGVIVLAMTTAPLVHARSPVPRRAALFDVRRPLRIARQGVLFITGTYAGAGLDQTMSGQMYVQYQIPARRTRPYPIIMIHGGWQTGVNFLATPDGRPGWADYFLSRGYAVYVVDQVGRGRSGFFGAAYGQTRSPSVGTVTTKFTAPEKAMLWPQAARHTQWPGAGEPSDVAFDEFYASEVEDMADGTLQEQLNADAVARLMDRIGPAVLLTHSQSGSIGWRIADLRPKLTKGIIALEPFGPPFFAANPVGPPGWFEDGPLDRPWGITRGPMTFSPAATSPSAIRYVREDKADAPDLVRCYRQAEPARRLPNLAGIPIAIITSEASYHAFSDHCTSRFLTQAGVKNDFLRLADYGIYGNGHMMFLEKNSLVIARFVEAWERRRVR